MFTAYFRIWAAVHSKHHMDVFTGSKTQFLFSLEFNLNLKGFCTFLTQTEKIDDHVTSLRNSKGQHKMSCFAFEFKCDFNGMVF